jgi:hypothetical protein
MSNQLRIEVRYLKGTVMDIRLFDFRGSALEEENVVIGVSLPKIEMHER